MSSGGHCWLIIPYVVIYCYFWEHVEKHFGNLEINHANNLEHFEKMMKAPKSEKIEMV
jgi:hypothetical protein